MASIFGKKENNTGAVVINKVDQQTGQVLSMTPVENLAIPDMSTVTKISDVAGKNPEMVNLRDHPELAGMNFLILRARFANGMIDGRNTDYCLLEGFIYPPSQAKPTEEQRVLVCTGSDNIYQRAAQAMAAEAFPIVGTLRFAGRARFLD